MMTLNPTTLALLPLWYIAFLFSLTCHEAAHALAAKLGGDPTAFLGGQVTLNPIPHMRREPMGTIFFPLVTYLLSGWMMGWASAPFDPRWQERHPRRAAWMALAGPAANLALVALSALAIRSGIAAGMFRQPFSASFTRVVDAHGTAVHGFATFLSILFSLNLLLAAFNLLPIPPLDGNTAVGIFLPDDAALSFTRLSRNPTFRMMGLLAAWFLFAWLFNPIFTFGLNLLYLGARYR